MLLQRFKRSAQLSVLCYDPAQAMKAVWFQCSADSIGKLRSSPQLIAALQKNHKQTTEWSDDDDAKHSPVWHAASAPVGVTGAVVTVTVTTVNVPPLLLLLRLAL